MICDRNGSREQKFGVISAFLEHGIDTIMGPVSQQPALLAAILYAQEQTGTEIKIVDTPILNMEDSAAGRKEAQAAVKKSAEAGSSLCLIHHSSAEKLVNKQTEELQRIDDYTYMIREAGMVRGCRRTCRSWWSIRTRADTTYRHISKSITQWAS